jgi:membrane-bound lytic murein transglycosylase A
MLKQIASFIGASLLSTSILAAPGIYKNLSVEKVSYRNLPSWQRNNTKKSFYAFKRSCQMFLKAPSKKIVGTNAFPITVKQWRPVCKAAMKIKKPTAYSTRRFFEQWFQPVALNDNGSNKGFFTGYYLPKIPVSYKCNKQYSVPIYAKPSDLVTAKLGAFKMALKGKKIAGKVVNGVLYPYNMSRTQINRGGLKKKAKVLVCTKHRADRFFLQTQGSGIGILPNKKEVLLAYNGDNGGRYYPIGRWFLKHRLVTRNKLSMQSIYNWLIKNPKQGRKIMQMNQGFVFFRLLKSSDPFGTQHVPLTSGYSLAVDNNVVPLGFPTWLSTYVPNPKNTSYSIPFNRLLIAQDTGGAIKGIIRGDIYFGSGKKAALQAGGMKQKGKLWLLIPKTYTLK